MAKPTTKTAHKVRTYARNRAFSRTGQERIYERDSTYFLKLVVCIILGACWIKFMAPLQIGPFALNGLPIGLLVGLIVVSQFEKFQFNRKIWYAILVLAMITSYFLPAGIVI